MILFPCFPDTLRLLAKRHSVLADRTPSEFAALWKEPVPVRFSEILVLAGTALKTLSNSQDQQEVFRRLAQLSPGDQAGWRKMSAHQMLCHLRDSYCVALGE
jgi:hypothetical protein